MIAPLNVGLRPLPVVPNRRVFAHLDELRAEAAEQMADAFDGVAGKRIDAARVPGCGRHGVSRAINGSETNPLFRLVALFIVMKRVGMGRERALRMVEWMRAMVDVVWPPEEVPAFDEAMREEQKRDSEEDQRQIEACMGVPGAARRMLDAVLDRVAYDRVVVAVLQRKIAEEAQ